MEKLEYRIKELEDERLSAKGVAGILSNYVNVMGSERYMNFVSEMARSHRTIQQNFTRLCVAWLSYIGSDDYKYDGRNEASALLARSFLRNTDSSERFLPFV